MKIMIITCSPNLDGLTAACGNAAQQGAEDGRAQVVAVRLNDLNISSCHACNNGWGTCSKSHTCQVEDDFQALHKSLGEVDGYVLVTPVYWGEMSESAKAFFDRVRRCEALYEGNKLQEKPVICIAAAGGSGNGTITCLASMERLFAHMKAQKYDLIGITRKNRAYMLETIRAAAEKMVVDHS